MSTDAANLTTPPRHWVAGAKRSDAPELLRARQYPISRWYLRPAAGRLAAVLTATRVRPVHLTICGLISALTAAGVLLLRPEATPTAAALVLLYWFFDRADGQLARRQQTVSAWGAWLDGNVDELVDVVLHVATTAVVASQVAAGWPWALLAAFLAGKYLLMYGLALEESAPRKTLAPGGSRGFVHESPAKAQPPVPAGGYREPRVFSARSLLRRAYHLPGNADVRTHLLVLALAGGWLAAELALVAAYYNLRWIVRYVLVARRLRGVQ